MTRDLYHNLNATQILAPAVLDADQNAAAVDLQGFGACLLLVTVGAAGAPAARCSGLPPAGPETCRSILLDGGRGTCGSFSQHVRQDGRAGLAR